VTGVQTCALPIFRSFSPLLIPAVAAAGLFVAIFAYAVWGTPSVPVAPSAGAIFGMQRFSIAFLNEYWLHFELVSVLLVAAVVAALAVLEAGRRHRG